MPLIIGKSTRAGYGWHKIVDTMHGPGIDRHLKSLARLNTEKGSGKNGQTSSISGIHDDKCNFVQTLSCFPGGRPDAPDATANAM